MFNILGNGFPLLVAAFAIPYLLRKLGNEGFGLLTVIWAVIGYFGFFDLGVGRAMTYEVSRAQKGELHDLSKIIWTGLVLTLITGIFGAILIFALVFMGGNWARISPALQQETKSALLITALAIIPTTLTSALRGALEGFGRFFESNITRILFGSFMFFLPALSVFLGCSSLMVIAILLAGARFAVLAYAAFQLRAHFSAKVKLTLHNMKPFVSYGGWVSVSGVLSPLMVYGDRFFVTMILGAAVLPAYAIPQEGLSRLLLIPIALTGALMPRMAQTRLAAALRSMYWHYFKKVFFLMMAICAVAAVLANPILKMWISKSFAAQTVWIVPILCVGVWVNSLAQLPATLLHSIGKPKLTALLHLAEILIYCGLILFFTRSLGIVGAAVAWLIRVVLDFVCLHLLAIKQIAFLETKAP